MMKAPADLFNLTVFHFDLILTGTFSPLANAFGRLAGQHEQQRMGTDVDSENHAASCCERHAGDG